MIVFTANTANTDGATLEITEVGDLDAILKNQSSATVHTVIDPKFQGAPNNAP